jgi:hypothetical protein
MFTSPILLSDPEYEKKRAKYFESSKKEVDLALNTKSPSLKLLKNAYISAGILWIPYFLGLPNLIYAVTMNWDPILFTTVTLSRSLLKWVSLHIALTGGVHYGVAEVFYELEPGPKEGLATGLQLLYSFLPATISYFVIKAILFTPTVTLDIITMGFLSLISLQIASWGVDAYWSKIKRLPRWYAKHRIFVTMIQILATSGLFYVYYRYPNKTHLENDTNRISSIKSAKELEEEEEKMLLEDDQLNYEEGLDLEEILGNQQKN